MGHARGGPAASGSAGMPLFTAAFMALSIAELAYFTAFGLLIPVVPLFAADPLGAGPAGVGLAVGAFSVMALLLRPFAGRLVDRHGRRPLLLAGGLLFAAVTAAHLFATSLAVLVLLRLLLGAAEALFFVAATAALADLAPPQRLGEALSYNSLSLYLGIAPGTGPGRAPAHCRRVPARLDRRRRPGTDRNPAGGAHRRDGRPLRRRSQPALDPA